jgi:serine/threonine-protein kinase RsbT
VSNDERISIVSDLDIVIARRRARELASQLGFSSTDLTVIATAISEVARNICHYAGRGEVAFELIDERSRRGILVEARDHGPGIANIGDAMQDGFSTAGGLGIGLPGARRLMDEFEITSTVGVGTTVRMKKFSDGGH